MIDRTILEMETDDLIRKLDERKSMGTNNCRGYCDGCHQPAGHFTDWFGMMLCDVCRQRADDADEESDNGHNTGGKSYLRH